MSQYMLLLCDCGHFYNRSRDEQERIVTEFVEWARQLREQKRMVGGNPVAPTGRVVAMKGDQVTDTPYEPTPEMLGGYFLIEAEDYTDAVGVAKGCPGLKWGESVQVREIGH